MGRATGDVEVHWQERAQVADDFARAMEGAAGDGAAAAGDDHLGRGHGLIGGLQVVGDRAGDVRMQSGGVRRGDKGL